MNTDTDTEAASTALVKVEEITPAIAAQRASQRKYRLQGDIVNQATKDHDDRTRTALRWLHMHAQEEDISLGELAIRLKKENRTAYSQDSVYQALTGRRLGGMEKLVESIESYREYAEREAGTTQSGFIRTRFYDRFEQCAQKALRRHRPYFIFGPEQIGKTENAVQYSHEHNSGETIYTRMPAGGALTYFLAETQKSCGIIGQFRTGDLRRKIRDAFDPRMLWIIDEMHQCVPPLSGHSGMHTLEFIREVIDHAKCGAVLIGTDVWRKAVTDKNSQPFLRQMRKRGIGELDLPPSLVMGQLDEFAKGFKLKPAPDHVIKVTVTSDSGEKLELKENPRRLQTQVVEAEGLGRWIAILQDASDMANDAGTAFQWGHVIKAHAALKAMSIWVLTDGH